jgi:predicted PurR-regulated permease PerM
MQTRQHHLGFWLIVLALLAIGLLVFRDILLPFVLGAVIAYFLNPLADALETRRMGRTPASLLIVALAALALVVALAVLMPLVLAQSKQLAATLPADLERLRTALEAFARDKFGGHFPAVQAAIDRLAADLQAGWSSAAGQVLPALLNRSMALLNVVSLLFVTPLVAFYLLVDWHRMLAAVERWLPRDHAATIALLAKDIDKSVAAFIRGQGTICLLLGLFYAAGLMVVGLRYGLFVGLATGVMAFVPVVGWALGLVVALALALAQFGFDLLPLGLVAAVFAAGMAIDTAFLSPRLVGEQVGLHPVWLIFSLFAFSYLFGFVGTLVAVPLAAAALVLVRHAMKIYMESDVYLGMSKRGKGSS